MDATHGSPRHAEVGVFGEVVAEGVEAGVSVGGSGPGGDGGAGKTQLKGKGFVFALLDPARDLACARVFRLISSVLPVAHTHLACARVFRQGYGFPIDHDGPIFRGRPGFDDERSSPGDGAPVDMAWGVAWLPFACAGEVVTTAGESASTAGACMQLGPR